MARDGESIERILARGGGGPLTDWFTEPPPPPDPGIEEFFLAAWYALNRGRPAGAVAPGPIPYDRMVWYAERAGLEDVDDFCVILSAMDDGYLRWLHAEIEKKNPSPASRSRNHKR